MKKIFMIVFIVLFAFAIVIAGIGYSVSAPGYSGINKMALNKRAGQMDRENRS